MAVWYYAEGEKTIGPLNDNELEQAILSGKISGETSIWKEGMEEWQPLMNVEGSNKLLSLRQRNNLPYKQASRDNNSARSKETRLAKPPISTAKKQWYFKGEAQIVGPITFPKLKQIYHEHIITEKTVIKKESTLKWKTFSEYGFTDDFATESMWYYEDEKPIIGPLTFGELQHTYVKGKITKDTPIRKKEVGEWKSLNEYEFYEDFNFRRASKKQADTREYFLEKGRKIKLFLTGRNNEQAKYLFIACFAVLFAVLNYNIFIVGVGNSSKVSSPSKPVSAVLSSPRTKSGYWACRTEQWFDDIMMFAVKKDSGSYMAYLRSGKCIDLKGGLKVTILDTRIFSGKVQFSYQGTKYWAPTEAVSN